MRFLLIALMLLAPLAAKAQPYQVVTSCGSVNNAGAIGSGMGGYIDATGHICTNAAGADLSGANASGANVTATGGGTVKTLGDWFIGAPPGGGVFQASGLPTTYFWANNYGNCTWSTAGGADAGPCINAAIAAAAAAHGGSVVIPAGNFNVATPIVQSNSYVSMVGAGVGNTRDNVVNTTFQAATRLIWTGAAGGTLFTEQPTGLESMYAASVTGITFDCASLANICAQIASVSNSTFDIGVSEPRSIGAYLTTVPTLAEAPGTQDNEISIHSRSTNASYSPTGILIDGASTLNVSYNRFHILDAWHMHGDGIVFGDQDNNSVEDIRTFTQSPGTGSPVIVAAPGYVMPNGLATTSNPSFYVSGGLMVKHTGAPVTVQGYTVGSTLTPGTNTGTAAVTPVTLTTNGTSGLFNNLIPFPSTTGVGPGMDFSCVGGPSSGVPNHNAVSFVNPTSVQNVYYNLSTVASGVSCTFNWGVTGLAVPGTYTITASAATTYDISAPAGGHTQTGIVVSGGVLTFKDVTIPITGNAVAGDTFTLVVRRPAFFTNIGFVDNNNTIPEPYFAPGSAGAANSTSNPFWAVTGYPAGQTGIDITFGRAACGGFPAPAPGLLAIVLGNCGSGGQTASGQYSAVLGGTSNTATGFGSTTVGGQGLLASGIDAIAMNSSTVASGSFGRTAGFTSIDRGRYATDCWGSGKLSAAGDAQTCIEMLRITTAAAAAVRLTADQLTAGSANCVNIPNNTAYTVLVTVTAFDHTTVTKNATWPVWSGLLTRGANAAATAVTMNTTPTPLTNGTLTGQAIAITADTTNGCLNVSYTPPTGNTDTFNIVARVETVEVQ